MIPQIMTVRQNSPNFNSDFNCMLEALEDDVAVFRAMAMPYCNAAKEIA